MEIYDIETFDWVLTVKTHRLGKEYDLDIFSQDDLRELISLARAVYQPEIVDLILFHSAVETEVCDHDDFGNPILEVCPDSGWREGRNCRSIDVVSAEDLDSAIFGESDALIKAIESYQEYLTNKSRKEVA